MTGLRRVGRVRSRSRPHLTSRYPTVRRTHHDEHVATVDQRSDRRAARRGRDRGRVRLHAQGPADRAQRQPLPRGRAARPHRRDPGARVPRRRLPRRPVRARRPRARSAGASSASATSCRSSCSDPARRGDAPTRPSSCRSPTATSRSSTASSSTSPARCTTRTCARWSTRSSATRRSARSFRRAPCTRAGHHAYLGGLLEHTVAVATLALETCVLHPRLNSRPADLRGDPARRRQDARVRAGRRDRAQRGRGARRATWRSASR